jgi:tRNA threonylcarbamoyladenosine biosynthesis protein TsaB
MTGTLLLALDTSTSIAGVALFDGHQVLSETTWLAGREHSTRLLVELDIVLARVGRSAAELTGVVVACGPGSFTGVRVAISVAKGIATARCLPLWGVSSLDVTAAPVGLGTVRAVLVAGRGRFATAGYHGGQLVDAPRLASLDALIELINEDVVIGELDELARARIARDTRALCASPAASLRRAAFAAELGWRRARAGDSGDPRAVDAIYVS